MSHKIHIYIQKHVLFWFEFRYSNRFFILFLEVTNIFASFPYVLCNLVDSLIISFISWVQLTFSLITFQVSIKIFQA